MPLRLILVAVLIAAAQASPPPAPAHPPRTLVKDSRVSRTVDCHGGDLTVVGDDDQVTVQGCVGVTVIGDRNHVRAALLEDSFIEVSGQANVVRWTAAPGWSPRVEAKGGVNTLAPL